ncbi:MAG TPA: hypothetical protein VMH83_02800 [Candidatus Acidoferrum sp.]|nr:hypothetical protein [Candidatus Acidoferrum sp.]
MKTADQVVTYSVNAIQKPATAKAAAGNAASGRDHIDTINQLFAELELAYHNQFHKAFAGADNLTLAKKYWLQALGRFAPEVIRRAVRQVVLTQQFLPSLATMIAACEDSPSPQAAAEPVQLPSSVPNPLSAEANRAKMKALRKQFDL